jgi:hypothetical protein
MSNKRSAISTQTASQAADSVAVYAESQARFGGTRTFQLPWSEVANSCAEMTPANMYAILAESGHGKTWITDACVPSWAEQVDRINREQNKNCWILRVCTEESVEESYAGFCQRMGMKIPFARISAGKVQDIAQLRSDLSKFSGYPIIFVGNTLVPDYHNFNAGDVTFGAVSVDDVAEAARAVISQFAHTNSQPAEFSLAVFGNYQNMTAGERDKKRDMDLVADQLKRFSMSFSLPLWVETQARRNSERKDVMPRDDDVEWSNHFRQNCTGMLGVVYTIKAGTEYRGKTSAKNLFVIRNLKWRESNGVSDEFFMVSDYDTRRFSCVGKIDQNSTKNKSTSWD